MEIQITARHLKLTQPLREYVEQKIGRIQRYFGNIVWAQAILSVEKRNHQAEVVLHASGQTLRALGSGGDLYAAVDMASDRMEAQVKKYKERLKSRHKSSSVMGSLSDQIADGGLPGVRFSVVKRVPLRPLSREEAGGEMELMGYDFWVFLDRESRQVQVVYRRQDGTCGLLQPVRSRER
ncbi:MAG: ribosome-associated translation inhibitor RaiA [Elusimicrobia bacterium]|nr:ribosome-associated translation inhibitor RaiA [Elusimicrobiota bacterium]